jgi:hypothetical protein
MDPNTLNILKGAAGAGGGGFDLAVGGDTSPYITVYTWDSGFGTKYANPSSPLPSTVPGPRSITWSPDGADIAMASWGSPYILVYPWTSGINNGFGTKYSDPSTSDLPISYGYGTAFSPDGADLAVGHGNNWGSSPGLSVYPWTSGPGNGFGAKYPDPLTPPMDYCRSVAFSPDGADLAAVGSASPGIYVYPWSSGFGTKYADPSTLDLPGGTPNEVVFSPDGADIAVTAGWDPWIYVYPWTTGTGNGFGTKYANPSQAATNGWGGVVWSPDGADIVVTGATSPYIYAYPWTSGTGNGFGPRRANPSTPDLLPAQAYTCTFSPDGADLVVGHNTSPYITAYSWSSGFGTKYADPSTLPVSTVFSVAFSPG